MLTFSNNERMAILLNLMGDSAINVALKSIPGTQANSIRKLVTEYKTDPPTQEVVDFVVNDFERYFKFALSQLDLGKSEKEEETKSTLGPQITFFDSVQATDDPSKDLTKLNPYQIAAAIIDDQPKTIALILSQLDPEFAANVLEFIPEAVRVKAFMMMSQPVTVPLPIVQRVLRSAFEKANSILYRRIDPDVIDQLVETVRSLPKELRRSMMAQLKDEAAELAEQIQVKMYRFEDLLRLNDRSIQAVLAKIQSEQLVMALTRAKPEIAAKLLNNMSKRARQSIEEEIGFNERATDEEIEAARFEIAQTLGKMDEAGEVSL